jgi:AraC-like DNA-binding protein
MRPVCEANLYVCPRNRAQRWLPRPTVIERRRWLGRVAASSTSNASTVAAELSCSRRQLQRILAIHGTCFRVELTQARMERGARKLVETRSIATASSLSGYQHRRHFSTAFRTYYGVTPGDVIFAAHVADLLTSLDPTSPLELARWAHLHRLLLLTLGSGTAAPCSMHSSPT